MSVASRNVQGVIGNPSGFARNVGLGIRAFLSVSSKEVVQSPIRLLNGIAQGSKSLLSNTVYAISSATTQFTKTAHKGIVAFTFDEQAGDEMEHKFLESHGKGILSEFLEIIIFIFLRAVMYLEIKFFFFSIILLILLKKKTYIFS